MAIYFAEYFAVNRQVVDEYGAFNISLVTDLPLFIDPFLLFNSRKQQYRNLHDQIIRLSEVSERQGRARGDTGWSAERVVSFPRSIANLAGFFQVRQ
jgi:hypothetical protein